jgi:tetratricopeptide (TPR) repeat protein
MTNVGKLRRSQNTRKGRKMSEKSVIKLFTDQAIEAALQLNWPVAIERNLQILALEPSDIPTLNRLAKAYKETGCIDKAVTTYQRVICLDRYNLIAKKNLDYLSLQADIIPFPCGERKINTDFVEEPGKTKSFPLIRLGDPKLITSLQPGQVVNLAPKPHTISVSTDQGQHIGALTDDVAYSLKHFINAGNTYQATIKSCALHSITIFIRETSRAKNLKNTPTF